jgi:multidrug efflux pump
LTAALTLSTVALNIYLFYAAPKGFFPEQDNGRLAGAIVADQDTSYQAINRRLVRLIEAVRSDTAIYNVLAFTGTNGATNTASMFIGLKPLDQRRLSAPLIIARIRKSVSKQAGLNLYLQATQDLRIGGRSSNAEYQYSLTSPDLHALNEWAPKLLAKLRSLPQITDVSSDQQNGGLATNLNINRDSAARLGLSTQIIDDTLYDAFGQREVSTMYTPLNQYFVVMEMAPQFARDSKSIGLVNFNSQMEPGSTSVLPSTSTTSGGAGDKLTIVGTTTASAPSGVLLTGANAISSNLPATTSSKTMTPLLAVGNYKDSTTSLAVNHQGQFPAVTMSFNLASGVALGEVVTLINEAENQLHMPSTIRGAFAGTAQAFQASLANESFLIMAALLSVYIVLGILYESYVHPLTILSTLPSAGIGALLALRICDIDLNVIALVGIILLIGIVKKNAILMIDFALDAERRQGKVPEDAIFQACLLRFRPIMMTTMAALLGGLPLAIGSGMGSELRRPLGVAIVGGLLVSQVLTLFTTPIVYLYLDRFRLWALGLRVSPRARRPPIGQVS